MSSYRSQNIKRRRNAIRTFPNAFHKVGGGKPEQWNGRNYSGSRNSDSEPAVDTEKRLWSMSDFYNAEPWQISRYIGHYFVRSAPLLCSYTRQSMTFVHKFLSKICSSTAGIRMGNVLWKIVIEFISCLRFIRDQNVKMGIQSRIQIFKF